MRAEDYTIAILCALPVEHAAICALLSEIHQPLVQRKSDRNAYILGLLGRHNVVITKRGLVPAAVVATSLQLTFPRAKHVLVVSVGGGRPGEHHDIRLGDVVVGAPTDKGHGVVEYDMRQSDQKAESQLKSQVKSMSQLLLKAIKTLQSDYAIGKGKFQSIVSDFTSQNSRNPRFLRPEIDDELFHSSHTCSAGERADSPCDRSQLIIRKPRSTSFPVIHYGAVVPGNGVHIVHGLGHTFEVLCIEMGVGTLLSSFPCVFIKGICDYADSHRNKDWQPYAALSAAACAKELIDRISIHQVEADKTIPAKPLVEQRKPMPRGEWTVERYADTHARKRLHDRICDYDSAQAHYLLSRERLDGSTEWILSHPKVQKWLDARYAPPLWFYGGTGTGKTMICTRLVDYLQNSIPRDKEPLIVFYCDSRVPKTREATYLVSSMIRQLLEHLEKLGRAPPRRIREKIEYFFNPAGPQPDLKDMISTFRELHSSIDRASYVIDGFDQVEPDSLAQLVELFDDFRLQYSHKFFLATRDNLDPKIGLITSYKIRLSSSDTEDDMKKYIDMKVSQKLREGEISDDALVLRRIKERLTQKARGVFLWVNFQVEALWLDCFSDEQILSFLENLPSGLKETYDRCVARTSKEPKIAAIALRWLACARRILSLQELQEAVSFVQTETQWAQHQVPPKDLIARACANLIEIDDELDTVTLAHSSVRQYLFQMDAAALPGFITDQAQADLLCGEECLRYLTSSNIKLQQSYTRQLVPSLPSILDHVLSAEFAAHGRKPPSLALSRSKQSYSPMINPTHVRERQKHKLLGYAREYWAFHTKIIPKTSAAWNQFREIALSPDLSRKLHPWISETTSQTSQMHAMLIWASAEAHISLLRLLLEEREKYKVHKFCDLLAAKGGPPALHVAARQGSLDATRLLMEVCNVNRLDGTRQTALHHSAEKNHWQVVQQILSTKALKISTISAVSRSGRSALGISSGLGHKVIVELLIEAKAALTPERNVNLSPINTAACNGHYEILVIILQQYGKLKAAKALCKAAVVQAARYRYESILRLLLEQYDISADGRDDLQMTPLCWAARNADPSMVAFLLQQRRVNINNQDKSGLTPFHHALFTTGNRASSVMSLLLEREDVNLSTQDRNGRTPLHLAIAFEREPAVRAFLEHRNIDVNVQNKHGKTPLHLAVSSGLEPTVKALLERKDIDVNVQDEHGKTPLLHAVEKRGVSIVELLLECQDTDPNIPDQRHRTPLSLAREEHCLSILRLLELHRDRRRPAF